MITTPTTDIVYHIFIQFIIYNIFFYLSKKHRKTQKNTEFFTEKNTEKHRKTQKNTEFLKVRGGEQEINTKVSKKKFFFSNIL